MVGKERRQWGRQTFGNSVAWTGVQVEWGGAGRDQAQVKGNKVRERPRGQGSAPWGKEAALDRSTKLGRCLSPELRRGARTISKFSET